MGNHKPSFEGQRTMLKENGKRTNYDLQNIKQINKDPATRTTLKIAGELMKGKQFLLH